jgi:hypothetical protein
MYRLLRNTHLFLGLLALLFLTMYGLSGVQMAHNKWFSTKPVVTDERITIAAGVDGDPRAIARALGLRGELADVHKTASGFKMRVSRLGTMYDVDYSELTREAKLRISRGSFMAVLNRIHHVAGTWHEYWVIDVWGVLLALVSASLLVIGATGIYLWFKIHSERTIGVILLAINLGFCITLLALIRTA